MDDLTTKLNEHIANIVKEGTEVMERRDSDLKEEIIDLIMKENIDIHKLLGNVLDYCFESYYGYPNGGAEGMFKGVIPKNKLKEVLELIGGINIERKNE